MIDGKEPTLYDVSEIANNVDSASTTAFSMHQDRQNGDLIVEGIAAEKTRGKSQNR